MSLWSAIILWDMFSKLCWYSAGCLRHPCAVRATFLQCSCDIRAMFVRHSCNVRATFLQCSCDIPAMFVWHSCNVRVTFVQCSCDIRAMFLRHFCATSAIFLRSPCNILATLLRHLHSCRISHHLQFCRKCLHSVPKVCVANYSPKYRAWLGHMTHCLNQTWRFLKHACTID